MLKYACVYCARFVLINLRHCAKPWRWLVAAYRPYANPCCYVWLYYNWFFVFYCICAVLHGSVLYISCGLSAVKINEELLLLLVRQYRIEIEK